MNKIGWAIVAVPIFFTAFIPINNVGMAQNFSYPYRVSVVRFHPGFRLPTKESAPTLSCSHYRPLLYFPMAGE